MATNAIQPRIARPIHLAHAPRAEQRLDVVRAELCSWGECHLIVSPIKWIISVSPVHCAAVGSDALKIVRNRALDLSRVLALFIQQELLLPIDQLLLESRDWLGRSILRKSQGNTNQHRAHHQQNATHNRLQERTTP
jgi:hypothetical protein